MDDRLMQFRVGVMVIATLIVGGILLLLFGDMPGFGKGNYELKVHFPTAEGVSRGSPVKSSGILIGRVTKTAFEPDQTVIVTIQLADEYRISKDQTVRISSSPIGLGDADLQVVGKKGQGVAEYQPGDTIEGIPPADAKQLFADLSNNVGVTISSLGKTSDEIRKLAGTLNERLDQNKDKFDQIVTSTQETLSGLNKTLKAVEGVLGDDKLKNDLKRSLQEIPEVLTATRNTINDMQEAVNSANRNIKNLEGITKPLGDRGNAMVTNIDTGLERLASTLGQIEQLSKKLNSSDGTVGKLLSDNSLYVQLNEAASNINDITRRLRPIVEDVRVLTDKAARNPGIFLKDAFQPGAGTKYLTPQHYENQAEYDSPVPHHSQYQGQGVPLGQTNQQQTQQPLQPQQQYPPMQYNVQQSNYNQQLSQQNITQQNMTQQNPPYNPIKK